MRVSQGLAWLACLSLVVAGCAGNEASGEGSTSTSTADTETDDSGDGGGETTNGEAIEIRVAQLLPPEDLQAKMTAWYFDELESRTDGAVSTEVFYAGSLVAGADTLPALQEGRAEAGEVVPPYFPAELPLSTSNQVPIPDGNQVARPLAYQWLYDNNDAFRQEYEDAGIRALAFFPNGASTLLTTEPVESADDLSGRRIRIPADPIAAAHEALGVEPVFLPSEEVYESLQRGIIGGVTYPFTTQVATNTIEVGKYMMSDVGQSGGATLAMSSEVYDSLPESVKTVMEELNDEFYERYQGLLTEDEQAACDTFLEAGGEIITLPDAERAKLTTAVEENSYGAWEAAAVESGVDQATAQEVWDQYIEKLDEFSADVSYENGLEQCAASQ